MYQHEISIVSEKNSKLFPLTAITNLDQVKTLHLAKGEVVGFTRPESPDVTYIAMTNELNIEETIDVIPRNWIPKRKWNLRSQALQQLQATKQESMEVEKCETTRKHMALTLQQSIHESSKDSQKLRPEGTVREIHPSQHSTDCCMDKCENTEPSWKSLEEQWCDISEVVESDFLISPGDIYPNRKVQLEDADIKDTNKAAFELLCEQQHEAFSKNNKDIGQTQLIEMEIDTRDSLPVAQSPYTLPLKHYDWVRQEIEMLEKFGVIERSLSRWASPVIIVPKKSAVQNSRSKT